MRLLLFVLVGSVLVLVWAAWAIAKAIRKHARPAELEGFPPSGDKPDDEPDDASGER